MRTVHHALIPGSPGIQAELLSLHFGAAGVGPKVVVQAALHADEIPGLLVAHHLRGRLVALEEAGRVAGEVVLVPVANPLGLAQRLLHAPQGRFDLATGENFNRHYADLFEPVAERVAGRLGPDGPANVRTIRAALREAAQAVAHATPLQALRRVLLGLAVDADVVLDLHCDSEAVLHLYTEPSMWPMVEPLARLLGVRAVLLASESGDHPFDEACSTPWARLADRFGADCPVPPACAAVTVELRGEADVSHALAAADAQAIEAYLEVLGAVRARPGAAAPELPPLRCEPTPLAGSLPVTAPHAGVLAWHCEPGATVAAGQVLADLVEPMEGRLTPLASPVDGVAYARDRRRYVPAGASVVRVAGRAALRQGKLLSE